MKLSKLRSHSLLHYDHSNLERSLKQQKSLQLEKNQLRGVSLFIFGSKNILRRFCAFISYHKYFDRLILTFIVISTLTLALETPLDDPEGPLITNLTYIDYFMTGAFTIEALLKIISSGFLFCGKSSYIRDPWNILDFIIVISALTGIFAGDSIDISFIKALRILRILRPLKIISKNDGLKVAITSLFNSIPSIINLQIIIIFFIFLFSILQTTLFSGSFNYCSVEHLDLDLNFQRKMINTQWDCINYGGEWVKPDLHFDDTLRSMLTLMTIQTTEGWIGVMWNSVDAVGPYMQPKIGYNNFMIIYMMLIVIIICMLFLNLFVGVVIETYNREKEALNFNSLLKVSQRTWIQVQLMTFKVKP